jgi:CheY-like chemotaxis protein
MTKETIDRAFDPFFTTKPAGVGTGLGLSQVFGFIKQSKGHVSIYSEVGDGTAVKIYLPRLLETLSSSSGRREAEVVRGERRERILVVEDDPSVRQIAVEAIRELGYTVFDCGSAADALPMLESERIHLLLTDVVMPEVNGRRLAEEALRRVPTLKVLFMSGYTGNAIVHGGLLDIGAELIAKPFTLDQISTKIREALER